MSKHNESNGEAIHVMLNEPMLLRKLILKSAIESVKLQHNYSELISLQEAEEKQIKRLRNLFKELKELESSISELYLPKISEKIQENIKEEYSVKEDTDIERLKRELEDIEHKLNNL